LPVYDNTNFSWAFIAEGHDGGTRLIMRARIAYTPRRPASIVKALIAAAFGIGDVIQAGGMLTGIRTRVERGSPAPAPAGAAPAPGRSASIAG
jgi:hypothetical protein